MNGARTPEKALSRETCEFDSHESIGRKLPFLTDENNEDF